MNDKNTKHIIDNVRERRLTLGYSYQDLADKTGISKATLQRYETGAIKNLSIDKFEILANALDIKPSYLMGWDDNLHNSKGSTEQNLKSTDDIFDTRILLVDTDDTAFRRRFDLGYVYQAVDILTPYLVKEEYTVQFIDKKFLGRVIASKNQILWHFDFYLPSVAKWELEFDNKILAPASPALMQLFGKIPIYNESITKYTIVVNSEYLLESILERKPRNIPIETSLLLIDLNNRIIIKEVNL